MQTIKNIAIHHSGGSTTNNRASSAHLTLSDIEEAHRVRFNFKSKMQKWTGYNFVYDPKVHGFTQTRYIGEETAAVKGHNLDTISVCIIGNYSRGADTLDSQTIEDITRFCLDLVEGNKREWAVLPNTRLQLSPFRIRPHRYFTPTTECYGMMIDDEYFMREVMRRKYKFADGIVSFLTWLNSFNTPVLGRAGDDRDCGGVV